MASEPSKIPTPRTDAVGKKYIHETGKAFTEAQANARQLERDLAEATRRGDEWQRKTGDARQQRDSIALSEQGLTEKLRGIQWANNGYCPACGGWNANSKDPQRGCTPKFHTKDCWLGNAIPLRGTDRGHETDRATEGVLGEVLRGMEGQPRPLERESRSASVRFGALPEKATPAMCKAVGSILDPYSAKLVWERMLAAARSATQTIKGGSNV